ncbi:hypothetical protein EYF80_046177 [Liparis tanakae]|uniref:Uncharacterized protein n=1 Tax=Liparis tanakae TaxID=230148 RepID=A0A4Z2FS99_9TELE|nr:hypothetical protein EYF80_046177 [Liparis tanakae]
MDISCWFEKQSSPALIRRGGAGGRNPEWTSAAREWKDSRSETDPHVFSPTAELNPRVSRRAARHLLRGLPIRAAGYSVLLKDTSTCNYVGRAGIEPSSSWIRDDHSSS